MRGWGHEVSVFLRHEKSWESEKGVVRNRVKHKKAAMGNVVNGLLYKKGKRAAGERNKRRVRLLPRTVTGLDDAGTNEDLNFFPDPFVARHVLLQTLRVLLRLGEDRLEDGVGHDGLHFGVSHRARVRLLVRLARTRFGQCRHDLGQVLRDLLCVGLGGVLLSGLYGHNVQQRDVRNETGQVPLGRKDISELIGARTSSMAARALSNSFMAYKTPARRM